MLEDLTASWFAGGSPNLLLIVPALAFVESCVGIGLLVSGVFLLSTSTLLYASGNYALWQIVLPAFAGALAGDHAGYFAGRWLGPGIWESRFLQRHQHRAKQAETFLLKSAPWAICLGRLTPATRSITPLVAGVSGMPAIRFHGFDLLACTIWATGLAALVTSLSTI